MNATYMCSVYGTCTCVHRILSKRLTPTNKKLMNIIKMQRPDKKLMNNNNNSYLMLVNIIKIWASKKVAEKSMNIINRLMNIIKKFRALDRDSIQN